MRRFFGFVAAYEEETEVLGTVDSENVTLTMVWIWGNSGQVWVG